MREGSLKAVDCNVRYICTARHWAWSSIRLTVTSRPGCGICIYDSLYCLRHALSPHHAVEAHSSWTPRREQDAGLRIHAPNHRQRFPRRAWSVSPRVLHPIYNGGPTAVLPASPASLEPSNGSHPPFAGSRCVAISPVRETHVLGMATHPVRLSNKIFVLTCIMCRPYRRTPATLSTKPPRPALFPWSENMRQKRTTAFSFAVDSICLKCIRTFVSYL